MGTQVTQEEKRPRNFAAFTIEPDFDPLIDPLLETCRKVRPAKVKRVRLPKRDKLDEQKTISYDDKEE